MIYELIIITIAIKNLTNISVKHELNKAKSYEKKGEIIKARSIYKRILQVFPKNIRAQKKLAALEKLEYKNIKPNLPEEEINKLKKLLSNRQFLTVIKKAEYLIEQYTNTHIAWNILGVSSYETGQLEDAIRYYKKAISINPNYAHAYNNLGLVLTEQGKFVEAIETCKKAIFHKPDDAVAYNNLSAILTEQGKLDEAIEACKKSILLQPDYAEAYNNIGVVLRYQGKFDEAVKACKKSILLQPDYAEAYNNLGAVLRDEGKFDEAIEACKKSILLQPDYAEAYNNLGVALRDQGKIDESIDAYTRSISIKPNYAEAYTNLSATLLEQGKFDEAIETCKKAIFHKPDDAVAYNNLSAILTEQGKLDEAIVACKKSILLQPDYAEAYNNLGVALRDQGKIDESIDAYTRSISIKPDYAEAYTNLGVVLKDNGELNKAIEACKKAILLKPNYAEAFYSLSFCYNLKGDLENGLEFGEWRLREKKPPTRIPRKSLIWDGNKSISGKKFLVYEEQGLGDVIQFSRYLLLLKQKGAEVIFKVNQKMHALIQTIDNDITLVHSDLYDNNIAYESPLMSLPYLFNTNLDTIPSMTSYLTADHIKVLSWGKMFSKATFKVGICWQGSKNKIDSGRSFPLSLFKDISDLPNVELISLHKGEGETQIENIDFNLTLLADDFDSGEEAFVDTGGVMANCDLIITCDTAIAHLGGALGCRTWIVLKKIPDWRWMLDRSDSPWYPNMRLYRQKDRDNWYEVFETIKKDLQLLIKLNEN